MSRKAIIIEASDVKGQQDLPGARKDAENWQKYLRSDLGGAWDEEDITVLPKPSVNSVESILALHRDKFVFVAFSGHGYEEVKYSWQTKGTARILLNDYEKDIDIQRLRPKGNKGVLLVDACRGKDVLIKVGAFTEGTRNMTYLSANDLRAFSKAYASIGHREYWLELLGKSSDGIVTMQSCGIGEDAEEDPDAGGLYTTLLMNSANNWRSSVVGKACYWTLDSHNSAKAYMIKNNPQQNPEYSPLNIAFPFAVKV